MPIKASSDGWLESIGGEQFTDRLMDILSENLSEFRDDAGASYEIIVSANENGKLVFEMERSRGRRKPLSDKAERKTAKKLKDIAEKSMKQVMSEFMR